MIELEIDKLASPLTRNELMSRIISGDDTRQACAHCGVSVLAVLKMRQNDSQFDNDYRAAQAMAVELLVDQVPNIIYNFDCPHMARAHGENIKWYATKRARKHYGDKLDVEVTHVINLREAIEQARHRVAMLPTLDLKPLPLLDNASDKVSLAEAEAIPLELANLLK